MKRKFYANLQSGHDFTRLTERACSCGGQIIQIGRHTPATFIVNPPYKRKALEPKGRDEITSEKCRVCGAMKEAI